MDSLAAFLPLDRRRALNAGTDLPNRVHGAALFADISGFTALTAALRHELGSRRGAEEVVSHINRVYAHLIEKVHQFNGDIINFSGDAVTCWFDEPGPYRPDVPMTAAALAVACAMELQTVIGHLQAITTPAGTVIPLQIKVAIATGPARRFLAGDPQAYVMEVLAGATLDRMAAAEAIAHRGEIVVAADVVLHLDPAPGIIEWREAGGERFALLGGAATITSPTAAVDSPALDATKARPWLLPPIYENLRQGAAEFLAELRPAVSVFVRFSGIDYDGDDDAGHKLDAFLRRVQAVLAHYEGFLLQITMGDKGSYLYISFGAPIAHEDDVARAAAAALELRDLPATLGFLRPLQIGINRGLVHSGAYGSDQRRTYGVMGNQVNISARLMAAARPGQILISYRATPSIKEEFILRELPPITLKGIDEPFLHAELIGRRLAARAASAASPAAAMVGRSAERAQLDEALAELAAGRSATLLIEGAAGLGKSILLQELAAKAQSAVPGAIVLTGSGDAVERSTTYFAWRPIFEHLLAPPGSEDGRALTRLRENSVAMLAPDQRLLAPLLNVILPLDLPENELTEQLTGEVRQENTQQLLVEMLRNGTKGAPILLSFDDAHWLDSASWGLIGRVRREVEPALLVLLSRPVGDDASPLYVEIQEQPGTRKIILDTLPRDAVEELICRQLGVQRLQPAVADLIHEKAEGHPFFSEELAYALRDAGLIVTIDGEARTAPGAHLAALDFPNTIQGVITSRIDRLPPPQQLAVKVASVIGRIFAFRVLRDIYPVSGEDAHLRESLDRLARLEITPIEIPEPNLAYAFKHIVTREVVYSLMTFAQRQQLHRLTALWYEGASEGDGNRTYPLLAHHWQMAGDNGKAVEYYEKAGENAFRDFANQEAIRFLEQALELGGSTISAVRRARWRRLLGEARYRLTLIEGSLEEYNSALALLDRPVPPSAAGRGLSLGGALARQVTHRLLPGRFVGGARPEQREALLEASRILEGSAEIYYNLGDILASFYCTMNAFNLAERAGPSPELMRGYANMCATLGVVSLNGAADGYRQRALDLAPSIDDLPARAWSNIALSTHSVWVANWDRAETEIGEALAIYAQLGDWRRWGVAAWLWPQVAQSRGQLERARDLWTELYDVATRSRDTRHQVRGRGGQFFNFLSLNELRAAEECLSATGVMMAENPEMMPVEDRLWNAANAAWALRAGDEEGARASAGETLAAIDRARFKFDLLEVFATPAEVFLSLRERGEATAAESRAACKVFAGYARTYAFARPRNLRLGGHYAWLDGDRKKATRLWHKSLAQADALSMPYERTLTEGLMAKAAGGW